MQDADTKTISKGALIAIAAAYAACYELSQELSLAHWNLSAGLRLAALLLTPRRYWPALLIGEALPVMEHALLCLPTFGLDWALLVGIPMISLCMPVMIFAQRVAPLYHADGELNIPGILAVTLACALLNASMNALALEAALAAAPNAWPAITARVGFFAYLLGAYLGALTLTPSILAMKELVAARRRGAWQTWQRPLTGGLIAASGAYLVVATLVARDTDGWVLQAVRVSTILPILALTLRFGWQGGALSGLAASIVTATTSSDVIDVPMINAQIVLALSVSAALLVGVPIARNQRARSRATMRERSASD